MKWLFRFFLFTSILFTAGSSHHNFLFSSIGSDQQTNVTARNSLLSDSRLTPVIPVGDLRVFQVIEDEEDDLSSRVKKANFYGNVLLSLFYSRALALPLQSDIKNQSDNRLLIFNSYHRYIQLRTIRV